MKTKEWILCCSALVLISGCQSLSSQPSAPQFMNRDQVYELFADKTVESVGTDTGITSFTYYDPTGQLIQHRFWNERRGEWRVLPSGEICLRMEGGTESCRKIAMRPGSFWLGTDDRYYKYKVTAKEPRAVVRYRQFIDGNTL